MSGPANNVDIGPYSLATAGGVQFSGSSPNSAGTYVSGKLSNLSHKGIKVYINVTALGGTGPQLVVTIQGVDPVSGNVVPSAGILASAAIVATGETVLTVYPGLPVATNVSANDYLPPTYQIQAVVSGTTSPTVTATIEAALLY